MDDRYLENCTIAKTVLMLFVIIGHSISFWNGAWFTALTPERTSSVYKYLSIYIGGFHIFAFTMISGYLFYYLRIEKGKYKNGLKFIGVKFKRLIIPFISVLLVWVIPINQYFFSYDLKTIVYRYILATNPSQLWFLLMLFWVFIIIWPLARIMNEHFCFGVALMLGLYALGVVGTKICPNYFMIWTSCQYFIFFGMGFYFRKFKLEYLCKINPLLYIVIYCGVFFIYVFTYDVGNVSTLYKLYSYGIELLFHLSGALCAFCILQNVGQMRGFNSALVKRLAVYSMPIYLFHEQIIYIVIGMLNGKINIYVLSILCFFISVTLSYLISKILFKWKITRFLIGEK